MENINLEGIAQQLITAINRHDTQVVLGLFSTDAVIEDISVGDKFEGAPGIKKYIVDFFVGYHTKTELLSMEPAGENRVLVKVDFTGDFGHETGGLDILADDKGFIKYINAYLD